MTEYSVIEDPIEFQAACTLLAAGTGPVAVDVERASGFRYSQRAYLVQVFRRGAGVFLFDPPAIGDFAPLQAAIGDIEWVFHAASQDLPSLRELELEPPTIFDTELASRLLGHERVGLAAVVEDTLGITLKKEHSAADWSTRPLPDSWLDYAALDVLHLIDVRDVIAAELEEQEKTEFAAQEFAATLAQPPRPPREDPWRRLSGLHQVKGARASPSRARCGRRVRSLLNSRTPRRGAWSLTDRWSQRCSPIPRASRRSRACRRSTAVRAARRSTAGGRRSFVDVKRSQCHASGGTATHCRPPERGATATLRPMPV